MSAGNYTFHQRLPFVLFLTGLRESKDFSTPGRNSALDNGESLLTVTTLPQLRCVLSWLVLGLIENNVLFVRTLKGRQDPDN